MPKFFAAFILTAFVSFTPSGPAAAAPERGLSQDRATDFSAGRKRVVVRRSVHYHTHYHTHYWGNAHGWKPYAGYGWQRPYYYRTYLPIYYRPYPIFPYGPWW